MERMNYINKDKNYMTDAERIRYLEESIRELRKEKENLKKEKGEVRQRLIKLEKAQAELSRVKENKELIKENKNLKERVEELERERSRDGLLGQSTMEEAYNRIIELEEENKKLKNDLMQDMKEITKLEKENKKLKEKRIFSLGEYDYMILTSTTPQLKIIKKNQNYSLMEEDTLQELRDIGEI